ncbi:MULTISPECIES: division/cell wall cluster transcriptional repressor MraZ [Anaerotruncus]|uniref:Transcriptional regulator MraZ n=2 Tax=Anaerotruncus TaxID=244127 RepID=A0A498CMF2_9FIRM|nr:MULTISPECIES: division/cell wall cluster transcriptional repressor MraZ [Anaerotruncus]MBC3939402.1 division/cell wall cluster transcriptional repressor MraZ [Anaerotruncus massiliensis (ex Togo et al. 2019)]MCQ4896191.1 division/cell wall cluster transcriptional repressor MraZ [Anaerotruncus sp. DFI.9.16]RLL09132.1 transcriptional regulator MraZ [Anaerotruncus massiliensis (ex Liu et al. 2021)]
MLTGQYTHSIDAKGRVNFPAKLREELGERFIITRGLDNCLFVYSVDEWDQLAAKLHELPISKSAPLNRFFFAGAAEAEPDKQGRVLLPAHLREYAGLDRDVTIAGVSNRAEIWDSERWEKQNEQLTAESIATAMDELGF